jgi:hypothetical protein
MSAARKACQQQVKHVHQQDERLPASTASVPPSSRLEYSYTPTLTRLLSRTRQAYYRELACRRLHDLHTLTRLLLRAYYRELACRRGHDSLDGASHSALFFLFRARRGMRRTRCL